MHLIRPVTTGCYVDYASIQKYRDEARRAREAAAAYTPDARETFEEIARQHELLANAEEFVVD